MASKRCGMLDVSRQKSFTTQLDPAPKVSQECLLSWRQDAQGVKFVKVTSSCSANPMPATSETRFPKPAEAKVENPSLTPRVASISSPATSCSQKPRCKQMLWLIDCCCFLLTPHTTWRTLSLQFQHAAHTHRCTCDAVLLQKIMMKV